MKDSISTSNNSYFHTYLKGIIYSLGLALILILIMTTVFYFIDINSNLINPLEFIILLLCILYAGIFVGRRMDTKGWLHGIIVGVIYFVIFVLINLAVSPETFNLLSVLPKGFFFVSIGLLGGCLGINIR